MRKERIRRGRGRNREERKGRCLRGEWERGKEEIWTRGKRKGGRGAWKRERGRGKGNGRGQRGKGRE
jgi:hypothetical protein